MIALSVIIDDYSELRRLRDFAGFKNPKTPKPLDSNLNIIILF